MNTKRVQRFVAVAVMVMVVSTAFVSLGLVNNQGINLSFSGSIFNILSGKGNNNVKPSSTAPTYVLLVHGYDLSGHGESHVWTSGVNVYNQLVSAGYIVGVVTYYGNFSIAFSNGATYQNSSFSATINTPIENISLVLGNAIESIFNGMNVNLDIVAHSMGGLITEYMLEHFQFSNINLKNVIYIATPFDGSPLAALSNCLLIQSGYQADQMVKGSNFLTSLRNNESSAFTYYSNTNWIVYSGNHDPWWGYMIFSGNNDGVVSDNSATYINYTYSYTFNAVHSSSVATYTTSGISYFQDQNVANTILSNLNGTYN